MYMKFVVSAFACFFWISGHHEMSYECASGLGLNPHERESLREINTYAWRISLHPNEWQTPHILK
jgi:hypothetical protein